MKIKSIIGTFDSNNIKEINKLAYTYFVWGVITGLFWMWFLILINL